MTTVRGALLVVDPLSWACAMTPERAAANAEGEIETGITYIAAEEPVAPGCWWHADSPKDC